MYIVLEHEKWCNPGPSKVIGLFLYEADAVNLARRESNETHHLEYEIVLMDPGTREVKKSIIFNEGKRDN